MIRPLVGGLVLLLVLVLGFMTLNNYIYSEKQGEVDRTLTLDSHTWVWSSALYNDGREVFPTKKGAFSLTFGKGGNFSATTDCNSMGGTYTVGPENTISFKNIYMTKMFCEGSQEGIFATILTDSTSYHFTNANELILDLKFDSGSVILTPQNMTAMSQRIAAPTHSISYICADEKTLYAGFSDGAVALALADGREVTLAKKSLDLYANEGGEIVFYAGEGKAYVEERGVKTHKECAALVN